MNKPLEYPLMTGDLEYYWLDTGAKIQKVKYHGMIDEEIDDDENCNFIYGLEYDGYIYEFNEIGYGFKWRLWPEKPTDDDLKRYPWHG